MTLAPPALRHFIGPVRLYAKPPNPTAKAWGR
jgi:hypothetical protein